MHGQSASVVVVVVVVLIPSQNKPPRNETNRNKMKRPSIHDRHQDVLSLISPPPPLLLWRVGGGRYSSCCALFLMRVIVVVVIAICRRRQSSPRKHPSIQDQEIASCQHHHCGCSRCNGSSSCYPPSSQGILVHRRLVSSCHERYTQPSALSYVPHDFIVLTAVIGGS